jgi:carboxyl-terminal processing protease
MFFKIIDFEFIDSVNNKSRGFFSTAIPHLCIFILLNIIRINEDGGNMVKDVRSKSFKSLLTLACFCCLALVGINIQCTTVEKVSSDTDIVGEIKTLMVEHFYDKSRIPDIIAGLDSIEKNSSDVKAELRDFLNGLGVSHIGLYTSDDIEYYDYLDIFNFMYTDKLKKLFPPDGVVRYPGIGVVPRLIDGRCYAAFVCANTPAARTGILTGDELLTVDGLEYSPVNVFKSKAGRTVKLALRREENGPVLEREIAVENLNPSEMFIASTEASAKVIERDNRKFGYIRLYAFTHDKIPQILVDKLSGADFAAVDALILDLRGRLGGAPLDAAEMFVGGTPNVEAVTSKGDIIRLNYRWTKPLVAITGPETRSGMEMIAYSLKKNGVPLVGAGTKGAFLGGTTFLLGDGSLLMIPGMDCKVEGQIQTIEGVGVAPTVPVNPPLEYSQGCNPQLEAAVEKAAEIVGGVPSILLF